MVTRFAIVGCGLIGRKRLEALPAGSVVAVCDLDPSRARQLASKAGTQCVAVTDVAEALDAGPDAVIVSTSNTGLTSVTEACIRAGKHVLVEKPVATKASDLVRLATLAEDHGVLVRAGYNHRFHPAFQKARELVDSGCLGPLMFIRARYGHGGRVGYNREWRADPAQSGGGELMDQGVHLIDLAGWFLGSFTAVSGHTANYYWDMPVDDNAFISLRNAGGGTAWLQVSCTEWKNLFSFEIYGKSAKLHVEGLGGSYGVERLYYYKMLPSMGPPETIIYEFPRGDSSWSLETQEFMEDIRQRRQPVPGLREAHSVIDVVETIYASDNQTSVMQMSADI